jgi:hypothetical protein
MASASTVAFNLAACALGSLARRGRENGVYRSSTRSVNGTVWGGWGGPLGRLAATHAGRVRLFEPRELFPP